MAGKKKTEKPGAGKASAGDVETHPLVGAALGAITKKEKSIAELLRPAAGEANLAKLRALGVPNTLVALYARHDGSEEGFFGPYRLLPIADVASERRQMNQLLKENPAWQTAARWKHEWVPFLSDGDGQLYCFDPVGGTDGGPPGQVVAYDHETGPARAFASVDVFMDLVTALAKKGALSEEGREEHQEAFDEAYAKAENVGLAKMPPKELKKLTKRLEEEEPPLSDEQKLAILLPLTKEFGAEIELWRQVTYTAEELERWELMAEAAAKAVRLTPTRDRPFLEDHLVLALHKCGRDEEALAALASALKTDTNYPMKLVPQKSTREFKHRCFVVATEVRPRDLDLWFARGEKATERHERAAAFEKVIALSRDKDLQRFREREAKVARARAERELEIDRIDTLTGKAKLEALKALAEPTEMTRLWKMLTECATSLGDWKTAASAGRRLLEVDVLDYNHYKIVHFQVRALHELGRDAEALEVLKKALEGMSEKDGDEVLEAIPSFGDPKHAAFEEKCLSLAITLQPDNPFPLFRLAVATLKGEARRSALERVVALASAPERVFVPNPMPASRDSNEFHGRRYRALLELKEQALAELSRG